ncbi:MAG: PqqD family protein [Acutalibacteraceae bacterium]|nr:PqqD family protein [Acutalibacteraceae bacterium]
MYKLKDGFIVRKIGDQIMAVPVGTRTSDMHGMIVLSESAELLWGALEKGATIDELVQILTDNYEVDACVARQDAESFLTKLKEQGALD